MPHDKATWLGEHRIFLRDNPLDLCLTCHAKEQCEKCHSLHNVHNANTNFDVEALGVNP